MLMRGNGIRERARRAEVSARRGEGKPRGRCGLLWVVLA
jgi:hypothetical protein